MPILLILFGEIFFFVYLADQFGFLRIFAAYWIPTVLLIWLFPFVIKAFKGMSRFQTLDQNEIGSKLSRILTLVGYILLLIPLLSTRVLGLLFIIPGFKHFILWKFHKSLQKKATHYYSKFGNGFHFYYQSSQPEFRDLRQEEITIKDVTPKEIFLENKKEDEKK